MHVVNVSAVEDLAKAGIQYIVYWSEEQPGSQLIAAHFGHAFCAALRNPVTTIPEVPWYLGLRYYDEMHAVSCIQLTLQVLAALLQSLLPARVQSFSRCILPSAVGRACAICRTKAAE